MYNFRDVCLYLLYLTADRGQTVLREPLYAILCGPGGGTIPASQCLQLHGCKPDGEREFIDICLCVYLGGIILRETRLVLAC